MSDSIGIGGTNVGDDAPEAAKTQMTAGSPLSEDDTVSVSATLPASLGAKIRQRAQEEDRTIASVVKRGMTAYMKDWEPGQE